EGAVIEDSLLMGADYYEIDADRELLATKGRVPIVKLLQSAIAIDKTYGNITKLGRSFSKFKDYDATGQQPSMRDEDDKNDEINYARLQVLIVSVIGAIMATDYFILLSNDTRGSLNKIVYVVYTSSLIFSCIVESVTFQDILSWWFMQVNIGIILLCGGTLGWMAVKLIKPEPHMEGLIIAMCATGKLAKSLQISILKPGCI
ncbi:PIN-LIKES 7-like protein isoform X1, partial [Tanacetum coccineum]